MDALIFTFDSKDPTQTDLDAETSEALKHLKMQIACAAFVVPARNLSDLRQRDDCIIDCGRKHPRKGLSYYLLNKRDKIPIIDGSSVLAGDGAQDRKYGYVSAEQLARSIRDLLKNAQKKKDRNIYIIGADEKGVFDKLWEKATQQASLSAQLDGHKTKPRIDATSDDTEFSELLMELLDPVTEPEEVRDYIGESVQAKLVRQLIVRAAKSDAKVLIKGDTGTGKEIVARAIHKLSVKHDKKRADRFVAINCGAIPSEMFESELFGTTKGSATGVTDRRGLWEAAGHGTLFLDEIGELSLYHQSKVLRALQEGKIRRVGGTEEIDVYARIITATNRDLFAMVRAKQFREDLYYRLINFVIRTPALRDHKGDIALLARHFWREIAKDDTSALPDEIVSELQLYRWPGNARELHAVLSHLYSYFGSDGIGIKHLRAILRLQGQSTHLEQDATPRQELSTYWVECLRHLRRADEVVQACKAALSPLVEDRRTDAETTGLVRESLRNSLSALEVLCGRPLLFYSEITYSIIERLKEELARLHRTLRADAKEALVYWSSEVARDFRLALLAIFKEVVRIRANIAHWAED